MTIFNSAYKATTKIPVNGLLAYYPLKSDANDHKYEVGGSGIKHDGIWNGSTSYSTLGGKTTATFNNSNYINTSITAGGYPITIACLFYFTGTSSSYYTVMGAPMGYSSGNPHLGFCYHVYQGNKFYEQAGYYANEGSQTLSANTRHFGAIRIDGSGNIKMTEDSTERTGTTNSYTINDNIYIGAGIGNKFIGGVRCVAIWNRSISDAELLKYKNYVESL